MKDSPDRRPINLSFEEFSSQKFTQFKAKFPNKSRAQIDTLVRKEWKSANKATGARGIDTSNALKNARNEQKAQYQGQEAQEQSDPKKKLEFSEGKKKILKKTQKSMEDEQVEVQKKKSSEVSVTQTPEKKKNKKTAKIKKSIKKQSIEKPQSDFKNFNRYYYNKLKNQHPRWTKIQIKNITSLLWRKNRMIHGTSKKYVPIRIGQSTNPLTGRRYFGNTKRKQFSMGAQQIQDAWNRLPQQSKRYWSRIGSQMDGFSTPIKDMTIRISIAKTNSSASPQAENSSLNKNIPLSFMRSLVF